MIRPLEEDWRSGLILPLAERFFLIPIFSDQFKDVKSGAALCAATSHAFFDNTLLKLLHFSLPQEVSPG